MNKRRRELDELQLLDCLDIVRIRLEAGLSFQQSTHELPELFVDSKLCEAWRQLVEKISEGRLSATLAIESLCQNLNYKRELRELRAQKSLNAKMQSFVSLGIAALFLIASIVVFPEELRPSPQLCFLSLSLLCLGAYWMHRLSKHFERELWFGDWLLAIENISYELSWGQTLAQSLWDQRDLLSQLPPSLFRPIEQVMMNLKRGQDPDWPPLSTAQTSRFAAIAQDHGRWLVKLLNQGLPIVETLKSFSRTSRKGFERHLHKEGELLAWRLMLPLFVCLVPAVLLLLFGPLILVL